MSAELEEDAQLEIGHVLFMDVVGFSKLLVDEQSAASRKLNEIVRNTEQFRAAERAGKLMRLPTGDGMVLVFFSGPEAPARCAMEIAEALKACSFGVRMGIHSGPVNKVSDVNDRSNVAGTGINIAQRVMDCGDAGHILLSRRVSEDLEQHSRWRPRLHHLGEFEVKHGVRVDVVSLYTEEIGNAALPARLSGKKVKSTTTIGRWRKEIIGAGLIAIALAGLFVYRYYQKAAGLPLAAIFPGKSVAILPFKPLVPQARDEVLEAGMADTLITKLSTAREIIIPSLSAVRRYDDQKHDPVTLGRELRVNSVLEGSVQKSGDRIRVTTRLIKTADGSSLWADTFDVKFTDVFSVQDAIAQKVATALALKLSEEEQQRLTKHYTDNAEAYQLYLKGRFYWNKYTPEGFQKSIGYFKQALEKDPNYALAYSGLADSYSLIGEMAYAPSHENFPEGRAYAEKALAMDEKLASAHLSLAIVKLFYDWDIRGGGEHLRRAKELDPNNAQIYHFYGHYLELSGRLDEAVEETKRGMALDPTNIIVNAELALAHYYHRQSDAAIAQARKTLELDPSFSYVSWILVVACEQKGAYQEAMNELNRARPISTPPDWVWLVAETGCVQALQGNRAEAEKIIEELKNRSGREYIDPGLIAYVYVALGDYGQAFVWMEKAHQERSGIIGWLQVEPKFAPLHTDPHFGDLVRRMGLTTAE
ncbi:MAG TPA: tetratricopeptide repeat protein [Chthoniobacterales bacterium]|jgi:TolB-like protein/class 3 adenylate cyclase/Flp pilus assembly protein TadD